MCYVYKSILPGYKSIPPDIQIHKTLHTHKIKNNKNVYIYIITTKLNWLNTVYFTNWILLLRTLFKLNLIAFYILDTLLYTSKPYQIVRKLSLEAIKILSVFWGGLFALRKIRVIFVFLIVSLHVYEICFLTYQKE